MPAKTPHQSYVYFSLSGDDFDPEIISERLDIIPGHSRKKEAEPKGNRANYSAWELHSKATDYLNINNLIDEVIHQLMDKVKLINSIKSELRLESALDIVLYIDTNEDVSTPFLGHDLSTIQFFYETGTRTAVDIYRFDSADV